MTHELPLVTAVILNWNGREYLADCLDSLRGLDYPRERLELLLVDNGSADGSAGFVREQYPEVQLIELPQNVGSCVARNLGVREARGEYIALLDNDAHVESGWLRTLVAAVQAEPEVVCASSRLMNLAGDRVEFGGSSINFYGYGYQEGYDRGNVAAYTGTHPTIFPCIGAALIRRDVYLEAGGLDEDYFIYYEDVFYHEFADFPQGFKDPASFQSACRKGGHFQHRIEILLRISIGRISESVPSKSRLLY